MALNYQVVVVGGILNQCIHSGFGLHYFKEELTGPEYAGRFVRKAAELGVEIMLDTMVLAVEPDHTIHAVNTRDGLLEIHASAVVLACVELMPYSNGLNRNIVQCLHDYNIPLYLSHTITNIIGRQRVEQVVVSQVGPDRKPIPGTEITFDCDTVLLSVGLIPENELTRAAGIPIDTRTSGAVVYENMETATPGIFSCGNVVHVHDLVDFVTAESQRAGAAAAKFAAGSATDSVSPCLDVINGEGVTYTVPQKIRPANVEKGVDLFFRVNNVYRDKRICVTCGGQELCGFSREYMAPGEMEHIVLPKVLLDKAQSGQIAVSLADAKGVTA